MNAATQPAARRELPLAFMPRLVPLVLDGTKTQTRRAPRLPYANEPSVMVRPRELMKLFREAAIAGADAARKNTDREIADAIAWYRSRDTGMSSEAIWGVMTGFPVRYPGSYPHDPDDFGRCYRLLQLFPEWRPRLGEVATRFPATAWPALVREWDRLTALYEEELPRGKAPKLYALMQELEQEEPTP